MAAAAGVHREYLKYVYLKVCSGCLRGLPRSDYGKRIYIFDMSTNLQTTVEAFGR